MFWATYDMVRDNFVILLMQGEESRQQNCIKWKGGKGKKESMKESRLDYQPLFGRRRKSSLERKIKIDLQI